MSAKSERKTSFFSVRSGSSSHQQKELNKSGTWKCPSPRPLPLLLLLQPAGSEGCICILKFLLKGGAVVAQRNFTAIRHGQSCKFSAECISPLVLQHVLLDIFLFLPPFDASHHHFCIDETVWLNPACTMPLPICWWSAQLSGKRFSALTSPLRSFWQL